MTESMYLFFLSAGRPLTIDKVGQGNFHVDGSTRQIGASTFASNLVQRDPGISVGSDVTGASGLCLVVFVHYTFLVHAIQHHSTGWTQDGVVALFCQDRAKGGINVLFSIVSKVWFEVVTTFVAICIIVSVRHLAITNALVFVGRILNAFGCRT